MIPRRADAHALSASSPTSRCRLAPRGGSLEQAHQITEAVEAVVRAGRRRECAGARGAGPHRHRAVRAAVYASANRLGLHVHNLDMYQLADVMRVDMDLELPTDLAAGRGTCTSSEQLRRASCDELGGTTIVAVHLEPRRDQVRPAVRYAPLSDPHSRGGRPAARRRHHRGAGRARS